MFVKKEKIVLLILYIVFFIFNAKISARPLTDAERMLLYNSIEDQNYVDLTIDVLLTKEIVTKPEAVKRIKRKAEENLKKLNEKSGRSAKFRSYGLALPDGGEIRLSETRTRIGCGLKLRNDTTVFANEEKTETNYEGTTINTGFEKDSPSYHIEHKSKQVFIWSGRRWSGYEKLRFGKVDEPILMDIVRLCNPKWHAKPSKNKDFSYKGASNADGEVVDEIECIDPNGKAKYMISLDMHNDWRDL